MAFTPQFLDEIRARVPLADVVGRRVKLIKRGREFVGLCPFHNEKTPSFTLNEDKGFYHCFGCGAHGDVIGFAMRTEGLSFPESVERLAGQAGLAIPVASPQEAERAKRRETIHEVNEAACAWFEARLRRPSAEFFEVLICCLGGRHSHAGAVGLSLFKNLRSPWGQAIHEHDLIGELFQQEAPVDHKYCREMLRRHFGL